MPTVSDNDPGSGQQTQGPKGVHGQPVHSSVIPVQYEHPGTGLPESDSSHTTIISPKRVKARSGRTVTTPQT